MAKAYDHQMMADTFGLKNKVSLLIVPTVEMPKLTIKTPNLENVNLLATADQCNPIFRNDYLATLDSEGSVAAEAEQYRKLGRCIYNKGKRIKTILNN